MTNEELFLNTHFATLTLSFNEWALIYASVSECYKAFKESGHTKLANQLDKIRDEIYKLMTE